MCKICVKKIKKLFLKNRKMDISKMSKMASWLPSFVKYFTLFTRDLLYCRGVKTIS